MCRIIPNSISNAAMVVVAALLCAGLFAQAARAADYREVSVKKYAYDAHARVSSYTDPSGRVLELRYCTVGELLPGCAGATGAVSRVRQTGVSGSAPSPKVWNVNSNNAGEITAVQMPNGAWNTYEYDSLGFVNDIVLDANYPNGTTGRLAQKFRYGYDERGYPLWMVDPRGVKTNLTSDAMGRIKRRVLDPDGRSVVTAYEYDAQGNTTAMVEDAGVGGLSRRTEVDWAFFDTEGQYRPTEIREAVGTPEQRVTRLIYRVTGELSAIVEVGMGGRQTNFDYTYEARGGTEISIKRPGVPAGVETYDRDGRLTAITDARGVRNSFEYDGIGRLKELRFGDVGFSERGFVLSRQNIAYRLDYFPDGQVRAVSGAGGLQRGFEYDTFGRVERIIDIGKRRVELKYANNDMPKNFSVFTDGATIADYVESYDYDAIDRIIARTVAPDSLKLRTVYGYVVPGEADRWNLRTVTDAESRVTTYGYDIFDRIDKTLDADGNRFAFIRDNLARVAQANGAGRDQSWGYDLLDRATSHAQADLKERWVYRDDETLARYCPPSASGAACVAGNAQAHHYLYDTDTGRLAGIDYPERSGINSADVSYRYLPNGMIESVEDVNGSTFYQYDTANRLLASKRTPTVGNAYAIRYAYEPGSPLLESTDYWGTGKVVYKYDSLYRVTGITHWNGQQTHYGYRSTGQISAVHGNDDPSTTQADGRAYRASLRYDEAARLTKSRYENAAGHNLLTLDWAASGAPGYDKVGNPRSLQEQWLADAAGEYRFDYDAMHRITNETYPSHPWAGVPGTVRKNQYSGAGDATTFTGKTYSYASPGKVENLGFSYDDDYRLTSTTNYLASYDGAGRLAKVKYASNSRYFFYDGLGNLIGYGSGEDSPDIQLPVDENTRFPRALGERNAATGDNLMRYSFGPDGLNASDVGNVNIRYVMNDRHASVRGITDAVGGIKGRQAWSAYGSLRARTGTLPNIGFDGEYMLGYGLVHLRARAYDPAVGRFLQYDSFAGMAHLPQSLNRYVFVNGNPNVATDPSGHFAGVLTPLLPSLGSWLPSLGGAMTGGLALGGVLMLGGDQERDLPKAIPSDAIKPGKCKERSGPDPLWREPLKEIAGRDWPGICMTMVGLCVQLMGNPMADLSNGKGPVVNSPSYNLAPLEIVAPDGLTGIDKKGLPGHGMPGNQPDDLGGALKNILDRLNDVRGAKKRGPANLPDPDKSPYPDEPQPGGKNRRKKDEKECGECENK